MSSRDQPTAAPRTASTVEHSGRLLALLRQGPATTTELATALGVARSTVGQRLELLRQLGLVGNGGSDPHGGHSTRGRPAAVSRFDPTAALVLLAHVGLSGSRVAAADLDGTIIRERFIAIPVSDGRDRLVRTMIDEFTTMITDAGMAIDQVAGIGIGLPTRTDLRSSFQSGEQAAQWERSAFQQAVQDHFAAPVFLDLDVNLLAQAEYRRSSSGDEVFVCVKLGTLIDSAILINGVPVHGTTDRAGELGHVKVSGSSAPCSCGADGCLDASASGSALTRQLTAAGLEVDHVSQVVELANQGNPVAVKAVRDAGRQIGEVLAAVVNLLNPARITTWGYLTEAEPILLAGIHQGLYQAALPESSKNLQLERTALGDLAGVNGAALMVLDRVLQPDAVDRVVARGSWAVAETA